ncbi:hypothetical protein EV356DRAFT_339279 [Viridothelium virens]|uniref:Integral membrane protein n=1 Tax=Viridothelium virens TaxID=1048519 RepID=A0A6A6HL32_VIRVR|nr:hypothetical protein EV356DRAFT_339279 [Viridothelium virens]
MPTTDPDAPLSPHSSPSIFNWILGFLLVGMAWGLTTPFMRRAAANAPTIAHPSVEDPKNSWIWRKVLGVFWGIVDTVRRPSYAVPFLLNVTGSVWFFLLIGKAELSLTVPITNSLAFLFTVVGEWWAEGKVISRDTWIGMTLVLAGIALCVQSKSI